MTQILLDTNIILDVLLNRSPWVKAASVIWQAVDEGKITAYVSACALTDIHYVAQRLTDATKAKAAIEICAQAFELCSVNRQVIRQALTLPGNDFEDNLQIAVALSENLDGVVTRDKKGFKNSTLPVYTPDQFIKTFKL